VISHLQYFPAPSVFTNLSRNIQTMLVRGSECPYCTKATNHSAYPGRQVQVLVREPWKKVRSITFFLEFSLVTFFVSRQRKWQTLLNLYLLLPRCTWYSVFSSFFSFARAKEKKQKKSTADFPACVPSAGRDAVRSFCWAFFGQNRRSEPACGWMALGRSWCKADWSRSIEESVPIAATKPICWKSFWWKILVDSQNVSAPHFSPIYKNFQYKTASEKCSAFSIYEP